MIVTSTGLGKTYGKKRAVDDLSFELYPGHLTGFLGPNGSGKSTTMRLMLGLDHGEGRTTWDGRELASFPRSGRIVGAHLDARSFHPTRTVRRHLWMCAAATGTSRRRVDEVIETVGLSSVANKTPNGFSLGMAQRFGLASAILAQPDVLMLDEPANGLDPQGIQWLREYLHAYASTGRVVLVSSHLLSEMQLMADRVLLIGRGRLIANESMEQFLARNVQHEVTVRSGDPQRLLAALDARGFTTTGDGPDGLLVRGANADQVGQVALDAGVALRELSARTGSLEQVFISLTADEQEYAGSAALNTTPEDLAGDPGAPQ